LVNLITVSLHGSDPGIFQTSDTSWQKISIRLPPTDGSHQTEHHHQSRNHGFFQADAVSASPGQASKMARCQKLSTRVIETPKPSGSVTLPGGFGIRQTFLPVPVPSLALQNRLKSVAFLLLRVGKVNAMRTRATCWTRWPFPAGSSQRLSFPPGPLPALKERGADILGVKGEGIVEQGFQFLQERIPGIEAIETGAAGETAEKYPAGFQLLKLFQK
jgi:hypothetical protein